MPIASRRAFVYLDRCAQETQGGTMPAYSDTTGDPIIFGTTSTGKRIAVVYSDESDADLVIIRPVMAYPVPEYGD